MLCFQKPRSQSGIEIPPKTAETPWPIPCHHDRQAAVIRCGNENDWQSQPSGSWPPEKQSRREFTSTVSTTRAGNAAFPQLAEFAEIRLGSFFHPQPFQSPAPPRQQRRLQAKPPRRYDRMASASCGLNQALFSEAWLGVIPLTMPHRTHVPMMVRRWRRARRGQTISALILTSVEKDSVKSLCAASLRHTECRPSHC